MLAWRSVLSDSYRQHNAGASSDACLQANVAARWKIDVFGNLEFNLIEALNVYGLNCLGSRVGAFIQQNRHLLSRGGAQAVASQCDHVARLGWQRQQANRRRRRR